MINIILLSLSLVPANTQTAQVRPCVWPNVCKTVSAPEAVAQFRPCVWPNVCKTTPAVPADASSVISAEVAQFTTCVYPRKCGKNA
jgi:hypothetical protein